MALAATCTIRLASPSPIKINFPLSCRPLTTLSTTGASRQSSPLKQDYKSSNYKFITANSYSGNGGEEEAGAIYGWQQDHAAAFAGDGGGSIGNGSSYGGNSGGGDEGGEEKEEGPLFGWLVAFTGGGDDFESDVIRAIWAEAFRRVKIAAVLRPLLESGGLAFIDKMPTAVVMECGAGVLIKAEYEKRKESFSKHLGAVVYADVAMAANADFMLLRHPTVSLPAALGGTSYSLLNRLSATLPSRTMLVVVGAASALVGTFVADNLINAKKSVRSEPKDIPISTRVIYGLCMAFVTNLGYQLLAGGVEQRLVEPYSHQRKLMLSADCDFQVLTKSHSGSQMLRRTAFRLNGAMGLKSSYMALIRSKGSE